jgi:cardiolipin synthase (CMP-forming)
MPISRREVLNVPNMLSFYRLAMAPVIGAFALSEERTWFIIFLCISFVTDVLDGLIARAWNLCTKIGSRLDSIVDELTYVAALIGIFQFEYQAVKPHIAILYVFIGMLVLGTLIPLVKFKRTPSFHLYSFKANALLQGLFILNLFVFSFDVYLYYFVMSFGILACLEVICVVLVLEEPISNAKSLYWVLRQKKRGQ